MPDQREEVLNFIKYSGPVLPVQIAKHVNTNILFASAILSELVARKILRITHYSIGGSPLYYLPGQEESMDTRLSTSLGGKEKEAYFLLKDKKVLWEKEMLPWQRVAVKNLVDFSTQIQANANGNTEYFWKHNIVPDEHAKIIISEMVQESLIQPNEEIIEEQTEIINENNNSTISELQEAILQPEIAKVNKPIEAVKITNEKQTKLKEEVKSDGGKFYLKSLNFIQENKAEILKEEIIKKDKEIDFIVNIPSSFGNLKYLIKAKNKAVINEADVSMAHSEGQLKDLPVIFLVNGKTNKKALALIEQKMQGKLILKQLDF